MPKPKRKPSSTSPTNHSFGLKRILPQPDGSALIEIGLDTSNVPAPERRYSAELADIEVLGTRVRFNFGQRKKSGELRSLVLIDLTPESARQIVSSCKTFYPELRNYLKRYSIPQLPLAAVQEEPEQTVLLQANIFLVARAGRECSLDCHNASPWFVHRLTRNHPGADAELEPVVRVNLDSGLMMSLLDRLHELIETLPPEAK